MLTFVQWWDQLRVQQKVWTVVLVLCVPLIAALVVHVTLIQQLRAVQQQHEQAVQSRGQVRLLLSLAVDIEDAFRGYLLTRQDEFLKPMQEAESSLQPTVAAAVELAGDKPGLADAILGLGERATALLESKHSLIRRVQTGHLDKVLGYVRSGKGLALSDALRRDIKNVEGTLDRRIKSLAAEEAGLARRAFWGLLLAVVLGLALGLSSARLLTRSITRPLAALQSSTATLEKSIESGGKAVSIPIGSSDEIGQVARTFEGMVGHIHRHIRELEAINGIGTEINTIGPDGLDGVLRRITDRASEMLQVDVCLVMLRHEKMACWIVEAASGPWHEKLHKTVMLWDEFPIAVRSFETGNPSIGEDLRSDRRPATIRRNLMGESLLSIPLMSHGKPFGVLMLLLERKVAENEWNIRLAKGFAEQAAIAISNARLYEEAKRQSKDLLNRLRYLESQAETLAHDLKGPGERMEELADMMLAEYGGRLDEKATRWLRRMQGYGQDLSDRVENLLEVARVGAMQESVEALDPALVVGDVLKARAGELEERKVRVHVANPLPMVAGHRAYLRQVFDNLISNAVKFCKDRPDPEVRIEACLKGDLAQFSVRDNGCGIPPQQRDRVFEPFVRLESASAKGSGIGLTIVRRIIELYGGQVWIEPESRDGCTVMFTLPVLGMLDSTRPRAAVSPERSEREGKPHA